jgi:hypothetical protein
MCAWKQNDGIYFNFHNVHEINPNPNLTSEVNIKRQLRERFDNTKIFIVLVSEKTRYLYRFVRWEMEYALSLNLPVIAVNLNGARKQDTERCPPIIRDELAIHVSYNAAIVQYALENWPNNHTECQAKREKGPYYYGDNIYKSLGL